MSRRAATYILLGAILVALVLLALGWFPQEILRGQIEARLQAALGPGSRIERLHVVPGRLRADVYGLVIEGPSYRLEVPRARLVLTRDFVLRRALTFRLLELESPRLHIHPPPGPREPTPPLRDPLLVHNLVLTGGTVTYRIPGPPVEEVEVRGLEMRGSLGTGGIDVQADGGEWSRRPQPLPIGPSRGRVRISSRLDVHVDWLETGTRASRFRVAGPIGRIGGDLAPDLNVEGRLDLDDVERFRGQPPMSGTVAVSGRVRTDSGRVRATATVNGTALAIAGWPLDRVAGRVEHLANERTALSLSLQLLGGTAEGDVVLRGNQTDATVRFAGIRTERLERQGVDLGAPFTGSLGGKVTARGNFDGAMRVEGDVTAAGRAERLAVNARAFLSGSVRPRAPAVDLAFSVNLDASAVGAADRLRQIAVVARGRARGAVPPPIDADLQGSAVVRAAAGSERIAFRGRGGFHRGAGSLDLTGDGFGGTLAVAADLRRGVFRTLTLTGSSLDMARLAEGAQGAADLEFRGSGPLRALSGSGEVRVADMIWRGTPVGPATATIVARGGQGHVQFQAPDLRASGSGTVDQRGFRGTLVLADTPLAPLQPLLSPKRPLSGRASGTIEVDLLWDRPRAAFVNARLDALELTSGAFEVRASRPFTLVSRQGRVEVQGLGIEGPGVSFEGAGGLALDPDAPMDFRGRLRVDLDRVPRPEGWTLAGVVEGNVELAGTFDRPRATGLVTLRSVVFQRPGLPVVRVADGDVLLQGDTIEAAGLVASWPGGSVLLSGRVPLAAVLTPAQSQRLGLPPGVFDIEASVEVDLASLPARPGWTMSGVVTGDFAFTGTRDDPQASGFLDLHGVSIRTPNALLLALNEGRLVLDDDVVHTAGVEASLAGGSVLLSGTVPLAALLAEDRAAALRLSPGEADVEAVWRDVQAATLIEAIRGRPSRIAASLSGEARVRGRLSSWRTLRGDLSLAATTVNVQDVVVKTEAFTAHVDNGQLRTGGLVLTGPGGTFRAEAEADLVQRTVEASGLGALELRMLAPLLEEAIVTGDAQIDLSLSGPFDALRPRGSVRVQDGTLRLRDVRQPLTDIQGLLVFAPGTVSLDEASALLGGGRVTATGHGQLDGLRLTSVQVDMLGQDMGIRYPVGGRGRRGIWEELKARVDAELSLSGRPGDFALSGTVIAERSLYDADIFLEEGLLAPEIPPAALEQPSAFLTSIGLNVLVLTENPLLVRNNLAQLEAEGAVTLRGSAEEPAPFGRFEIRSGGKVFLQEREFTVESGQLIYAGSTDPDLYIRATTVIADSGGDIEVTIVAEGPLETPTLELSSDPSLSEREIASLIATGRSTVALDTGAWIVGEQAAALLAGRFTRRVARELLDLGLDQVDIQPELLAREGEPSARFTFGKQLTPSLRVVYSTSLSDPEAQYYQLVLRLRPGMDVTARAQRRAEGDYQYGVGQRLRFGGPPRRRETHPEHESTQLQEVRLEGDLREFPDLRQAIKAEAGDKVTYWDLLDDADRIRERLVGLGYLEAVVETRLEGDVAVFSGALGPRYLWRVEGMADAPPLDAEIRKALFEEEAVERGREKLLDALHRRGHLKAVVEVQATGEGVFRTLVFKVDAGPVLSAEVTFPGATALSPGRLLEGAGGPARILNAPREAEEAIRTAYHAAHYLAAKVGPTEIVEQPGGLLSIVIPVEEGPPATVAAVRFEGATLPAEELQSRVGFAAGSSYDPWAVNDSLQKIRDLYLTLGYPAVRVTPRVVPTGTDLEVVFVVAEGAKQVVGPIEIAGLRRTQEGLVRRQIDLREGEPLDPRKLAAVERRLRELGTFRRAVVTASNDSVAAIRVELEEDARVNAAYDFRYNADEGFSALIDGEYGNLFGRGVTVGARIRAGRQLREGRFSTHVPSLGRLGDLTATVFRLEEELRVAQEVPSGGLPTLPAEGTRTEQGLEAQFNLHQLHPWDFLYGYRFKRTTCPTRGLPPLTRRRARLVDPCEASPLSLIGDEPPPPGAPERRSVDVGAVHVSAVRDTRDNPLNPARGSFLAANLQLSPKLMRSDFDFVREFVHVSFLHEVGRSLVWAHGYRLGLIQTFGGERLPWDDLFKAGGPNTVRGYAVDSLGPSIPGGGPTGGQALVILNQELRYHHTSGLGAALFWDAGNVYRRVADADFKLRHALGVGLRYDSVIGLLRFDVAMPLGRRPGERSYQFYFGLGQAF